MKIGSKKELDEAIIQMERRRIAERDLLKEQYQETLHSLKPANLIKGAFSNIIHSPGAKTGILKTVAGLRGWYAYKRFLWGKSSSILKRLLGNVVKVGVTKTAFSNTDKIKAYAMSIYNNLFRKK